MTALQSIVENLATKRPLDEAAAIVERRMSEYEEAGDVARQFVKAFGSAAKAADEIRRTMKKPGSGLDVNKAMKVLKALKGMKESSLSSAAIVERRMSEYEDAEATARKLVKAFGSAAKAADEIRKAMKDPKVRMDANKAIRTLGALKKMKESTDDADALLDFTAEVQRRAREGNLSTRQGIHETIQMPETPDQLWESVNTMVPGMLVEAEPFETAYTGIGGTPTFLYTYSGDKKLKMFEVLKATKFSVVVRGVATKGKTKKSTKVVPQKGHFSAGHLTTIRLKKGQVIHPDWGKLMRWKGKPMAPLKEGDLTDGPDLRGMSEEALEEARRGKAAGRGYYDKERTKVAKRNIQKALKTGGKGMDVAQLRMALRYASFIGSKHAKALSDMYDDALKKKSGTFDPAFRAEDRDTDGSRRYGGGVGDLNTPDALFESCLGQGTLTDDDDPALLHEAKRGTVGVFLTLLSHKITRADVAQERRDLKRGRPVNIHALPLMLNQVGKVREDVKGLEDKDDAESLGKLSQSIAKRFNAVSPIKYTLKAISDFLATGKLPMIRAR